MHDTSAHAAQHHAPTSFIGKHVFSLDHKVIGKQYYALASGGGFYGDGAVVDNAPSPGMDEPGNSRAAFSL